MLSGIMDSAMLPGSDASFSNTKKVAGIVRTATPWSLRVLPFTPIPQADTNPIPILQMRLIKETLQHFVQG